MLKNWIISKRKCDQLPRTRSYFQNWKMVGRCSEDFMKMMNLLSWYSGDGRALWDELLKDVDLLKAIFLQSFAKPRST